MSVVRNSKFRHVYGSAAKQDLSYLDVNAHTTPWDSNWVAVSPSRLVFVARAGSGSCLAVIPLEKVGRVGPTPPTLSGHSSPVLDVTFSNTDPNVLASGSEDGSLRVWRLPTDTAADVTKETASAACHGHAKKAGTLSWSCHTDVLASGSFDRTVRVWDVEAQKAHCVVEGFGDNITSLTWSGDGALIGAASKDKMLRVCDPRQNEVAMETSGHAGAKGMRVVWLTNKERLYSVGFTKLAEREVALWDPRELSTPLVREKMDRTPGMLMPFYDEDTSVIFLAGKGDSNVRYYEVQNDSLYYLNTYASSSPQRGIGVLPKRCVDSSLNEILRMYKLESNSIVPVSFLVPRRSESFQEDLFPDAYAGEPALSASEWFEGKNGPLRRISFGPSGAETVSHPEKPTPATSPASEKKHPTENGVTDSKVKGPITESDQKPVSQPSGNTAVTEEKKKVLEEKKASLENQLRKVADELKTLEQRKSALNTEIRQVEEELQHV